MYPDPAIAGLINRHFIPVRVHAKNDAAEFQRLGGMFGAEWTPTTLIVDPPSTERHRIEGFLPVKDFASQLDLGLAKTAFGRGRFDEAERLFQAVVKDHPDTDAGPEAQYWAGVSRYKGSGDAAALTQTAQRFKERYADTTWAKKASVWNK